MGYHYDIDWSVFEYDPEPLCTCRCGKEFRSHIKLIRDQGSFKRITQKPCPVCNSNDSVYKASSEPERWILRG